MTRVTGIFTLTAIRSIAFDPEWYQNEERTLPLETIFARVAKEQAEDPYEFVDCSPDKIKVECVCHSPEEQAVHEYKQSLAARLLSAAEESLVEKIAAIRDTKRLELELSKARDEAGILKLRVEQLEQALQAAYRVAHEARVEASRLQFPDTTGS